MHRGSQTKVLLQMLVSLDQNPSPDTDYIKVDKRVISPVSVLPLLVLAALAPALAGAAVVLVVTEALLLTEAAPLGNAIAVVVKVT